MTYCPRCWRRYRVPGACSDCKVALETPMGTEVRLNLIERIGREASGALASCRSREYHQYQCPNCNTIAAAALEDMRRLLTAPS